MTPLSPIKLFRGDADDELVESFGGFTDLQLPPPFVPQEARYTGAVTAIPNGGNALLPWTTLVFGPDLLDRTNVTLPTFLTDGLYSLTCGVAGEALTPGGYCRIGVQAPAVFAVFYTSTDRPEYGDVLTAVFRAGPGVQLDVVVENHDGASARSFSIDRAILVKIAD